MSYKLIHTSLDTQLQTVTGLPTLQIENTRKGNDKRTKEWTRSTLLPTKTSIETLGPLGYNKLKGLYQIDIFYPEDASYGDTFDMAELVLAKFIIGDNLNGINILNSYMIASQGVPGSISITGNVNVPGYYKAIVMVEWEYFINRLPIT